MRPDEWAGAGYCATLYLGPRSRNTAVDGAAKIARTIIFARETEKMSLAGRV
jgi:hypothetical protein